MNILLINTLDTKGGAALVAYGLKEELERAGHRVNLFVNQKFSNDGRVFRVRKRGRFFSEQTRNYFRTLISKYRANDIEFFDNDNLIHSREFQKADVIHCHNLHGNYFNLGQLVNFSRVKPVVWTLHDMWAMTGHCAWAFTDDWEKECGKWKTGCNQCPGLKMYPSIKWDNTRNLFKKKERIYQEAKLELVAVAKWQRKRIKQSILGGQKVHLIYNGIENKKFKPREKARVRKKLGFAKNKKIIILVSNKGRENKQKGWKYAEQIIRYYKNKGDVLFLCVGDKKENKQLSSDNVKYVGYINDKPKLADYYAAADLLLFPSLAEIFPLVILEAMSSGLPIVSFDVGGVKEVVTHKENGYLAEYRNVNDLKQGIEYIFGLKEKDLAKLAGRSVDKIEKRYTRKIMTENYLKFYREIINE